MDLIKSDRINRLYDIYQDLLTTYQKEVFELYYQEDYSLSEIADLKQVSRNAVFTLLKRVIAILDNYEAKLHLLTKNNQIISVIEKTNDIEKIKLIVKEILESR